jgi:hypothetical protein
VQAEALNMCLDPQPWFKEEAKKMAKNKGQVVTRALSKSQASKSKYNFLISLVIYIRSRIGTLSSHTHTHTLAHAHAPSHTHTRTKRLTDLLSLSLSLLYCTANCSNYCPICDHKHECEGLKPIVCAKPDCVWRYEELGLGANVNAEIARAPEVVDLMISLACAGVNSGRGETILEPFPMADFAPNGTKDLNRLVPTPSPLTRPQPSLTRSRRARARALRR